MSNIWLVGAGLMAREYVKVLEKLSSDFIIVGRGKKSAEECKKITQKNIYLGGLYTFLATEPPIPSHAIVSVNVEDLYSCTAALIKYGVKNILVEKPGGLDQYEISHLKELADKYETSLLIAYNRRFFASVYKAREIIEEDGGIRSCFFEFTERSNVIEGLDKPDIVKQNWFIANSTHVVDLAFHLIGEPSEITTYSQGSLVWHHSADKFCGSGITNNSIMFSYFADWGAPGRWSIELLTAKNRLIFKPMEKLKVMKTGTFSEEEIVLDEQLDIDFKPGLFKQTETFLNGDFSLHCSIDEQANLMDVYRKMANYSD